MFEALRDVPGTENWLADWFRNNTLIAHYRQQLQKYPKRIRDSHNAVVYLCMYAAYLKVIEEKELDPTLATKEPIVPMAYLKKVQQQLPTIIKFYTEKIEDILSSVDGKNVEKSARAFGGIINTVAGFMTSLGLQRNGSEYVLNKTFWKPASIHTAGYDVNHSANLTTFQTLLTMLLRHQHRSYGDPKKLSLLEAIPDGGFYTYLTDSDEREAQGMAPVDEKISALNDKFEEYTKALESVFSEVVVTIARVERLILTHTLGNAAVNKLLAIASEQT